MRTTEYGLPGPVNEFGVEKPAKDVDHSHSPGAAMTGTKAPIDDRTLRDMVRDFHRIHGRKPSTVHLTEAAGHHRGRGLNVDPIGFVFLDFAYGAAEVRLE